MSSPTGRGPYAGPARTTRRLMAQVVIALAPLAALGVLRAGAHAAQVLGCCLGVAWLTELAACRLDGAYAVLLANAARPVLDDLTRSRPLGHRVSPGGPAANALPASAT